MLVSTGANDWMESNGSVARAEGGFRVSARRPFASGAPKGGILVTSAPYEDPAEGWQVLHFAVPFAASGVSLADDWRALGMRATGSHTVVLDGVSVPDDAVVLRRPRGRFHPAWNVTVAMPLIMSRRRCQRRPVPRPAAGPVPWCEEIPRVRAAGAGVNAGERFSD